LQHVQHGCATHPTSLSPAFHPPYQQETQEPSPCTSWPPHPRPNGTTPSSPHVSYLHPTPAKTTSPPLPCSPCSPLPQPSPRLSLLLHPPLLVRIPIPARPSYPRHPPSHPPRQTPGTGLLLLLASSHPPCKSLATSFLWLTPRPLSALSSIHLCRSHF
jgi:hypothetical protein